MSGGRERDYLKPFAARLRRLRRLRGWSQQELGDETGVSQTHVSDLEQARQDPRLGTVVRLAAALRVAPAALLGREAATGHPAAAEDS